MSRQFTPIKNAQTFLLTTIVGVSLSATAEEIPARTEGPTLKLGISDVPPDFKGFKILKRANTAIVITGIPKRNMQTGVISYLAISPINPVAPKDGAAGNEYFGDATHRPLTWSEASASCQSFKLENSAWDLPNLHELRQINFYVRFKDDILIGESDETKSITQHITKLDHVLPQYSFFWTKESPADLPTGLKIAGTFGKKGKSQMMTEAMLLSSFCITYFEGEEREADRLAVPTPKDTEIKSTL